MLVRVDQIMDEDKKLIVDDREIVVNHVMSADTKSGIFDDIIKYFQKFSPPHVQIVPSITPIEGASVYHYYRPHLEQRLRDNSVVTVHHDLGDNDSWLDFTAFADVYGQASLIVCLCTQQQQWLRDRGFERVEVIPHGFNSRFLRQVKRTRDGGGKITLGLASRRYSRRVKGEALLYELAKRLSPDIFAFSLVGPGRTYDASLLWELGFEVRVNEYLPYRLFQKFYEGIDALLVLSWHEGGPACIPEAIATGTPVFSTPVGMACDLLRPGTNGEFLLRDHERDAETISAFASDGVWRRSLQRGAARMVGRVQSWGGIVSRYAEVYREVADA